MVKHIVMMKFKDKQKIEYIRDLLFEMRKDIKVLQDIQVGINFSNSDRAMDLVLITRFNSENHLNIYKKHPKHLEVLQEIKKVIDYTKVVDFEF